MTSKETCELNSSRNLKRERQTFSIVTRQKKYEKLTSNPYTYSTHGTYCSFRRPTNEIILLVFFARLSDASFFHLTSTINSRSLLSYVG